MNAEQIERSIEYAKNYPVVLTDQPMGVGPITVGNIGTYPKEGTNQRTIINLCLRTAKTGERNASISAPVEFGWASKYQAGDKVNVIIEGGYAKKIWHVRSASISAVKVNAQATEMVVEQNASDTVTELLKAVDRQEDMLASEEEAKKVIVAETVTEENPF